MPAPTSPVEFLDLVRRSGVLSDETIKRLENGPPLPESPPKLAAALIKMGHISQFQAKLLLAGKHRGFKLGPYVVKDQLGVGGMGAVYLAEHDTLKRKVALKVLTADKDQLTVKRFAREARAAAALDHPNIVRLFDIAKQGEVQYLVMEYVDGQTLEAMMKAHGKLPYPHVVAYTAQIASGLQHAHDKGFVHRDIKPANLMVTKAGQAKLLDMGLARSTDAGDKLTEMMDKGAVLGTADYIAPEQAISGSCDIRADIYSLGTTFYTMTAGHPPFAGTTTQKLVSHQMKVATPLSDVVEGFPPELAAVVAKMMAKKPDDRYQTPAEVVEALAPWTPAGQIALVGPASSVSLADTVSDSATTSTKRLNKPSVKTSPTPVTALNREPSQADEGFPDLPASSTKRTQTKAAPARKSGSNKAVLVAAGVVGLAVAGGAAWVGYGLIAPSDSKAIAKQATPNPQPEPEPQEPAPEKSAVAVVNDPPKPKNEPTPDVPPPVIAPQTLVNINPASAGAADVKPLLTEAKKAATEGRWKDAATTYMIVVRTEPQNYEHWLHAVSLLNEAGDDLGFRLVRKEMLDRFKADADPRVRQRVAKAGMMAPGTADEMADCAAMAASALQERKAVSSLNEYYEFAIAFAEFRQDKFDDAEKRFAKLFELPFEQKRWNFFAVGGLIRGLTLNKLGRPDAARQSVTAAEDHMQKALPKGFADAGVQWHDWLIFQTLHREAEAAKLISSVTTAAVTPPPAAHKKVETPTAPSKPLIDLNPSTVGQDTKVVRDAAYKFAKDGQWLDAAAKYMVAVRLEPNNNEFWRHAIVLVARAGDTAGYNALRTEMMERFKDHAYPNARERTAKACMVLPGTEKETDECIQIGTSALQILKGDGERPYFEMALALAEYRRGMYQAASDRLTRTIPEDEKKWSLTAVSKLVQALAQYRLGLIDSAHASLKSAEEQVALVNPNGFTGAGNGWQDWVIYELLHKEIDTLLNPPLRDKP